MKTTVTCIVSDGQIWNLDKFIVDLTQASCQGPVVIDLIKEGPCCQELGLDALLDSIPNLKVDSILTSNQIPSSKFPEHRESFVELPLVKQLGKDLVPSTSTLQHRFALFVSRSNWQRLALASYLRVKYPTQSLISYHYDRNVDYHRSNFGLEKLLEKHWDLRHQVYKFLEDLPITFDQQTYPILWNQTAFELDYTTVFCEIVCETFFSGKTFMMTEKTLRPILQRRPFVVQGPKFFLKNLHKLGFKTFDSWWDESYDIDESDGKFTGISWVIDHISKQSPETLQQWYKEMQPILDHNAKTLLSLTKEKIIATQFESP